MKRKLFTLFLIGSLLLCSGCQGKTEQVTKEDLEKIKKMLNEDAATPQDISQALYPAQVPVYTVNKGLTNVVNASQFGDFDAEQMSDLENNAFTVVSAELDETNQPQRFEQPFQVYDKNDYLNIPNFVTTDSLLHLYHNFYDHILKSVETDDVIPKFKSFLKYGHRISGGR